MNYLYPAGPEVPHQKVFTVPLLHADALRLVKHGPHNKLVWQNVELSRPPKPLWDAHLHWIGDRHSSEERVQRYTAGPVEEGAINSPCKPL